MSAAHLLLELKQAGFSLVVDDEGLAIDGPIDRLDERTKARIGLHKAELIQLCTPSPAAGISKAMAKAGIDLETRRDLQEQFHERAGICEFDGGMSRSEAEKTAMSEILAEIRRLDEQSSHKQAAYVDSSTRSGDQTTKNPSDTPKRARNDLSGPGGDSAELEVLP